MLSRSVRTSVAWFKSNFSLSIFLVPLEHSSTPNRTTLNFLAESCLVATTSEGGAEFVSEFVSELGVAALTAGDGLLLGVGLTGGWSTAADGDWLTDLIFQVRNYIIIKSCRQKRQ